MKLFNSINIILTSSTRTAVVKKNIIISLVLKGLSIIIGLILVPLTINYLDPLRYGIWLTLLSITSWFYFFDLGIGNGLRNKFAESYALKDFEKSSIYISTAFYTITIISIILMIVLLSLNSFINWSTFFNAPQKFQHELSLTMFWVFVILCFNFVLQIINTILNALQKTWQVSLINFLGNLLSLGFITLLIFNTLSSFFWVVLIMSASTPLVLLLAGILLFRKDLNEVKLNYIFFKIEYLKDLLGLGFHFFIISITGIILFMSTNFLISHFFTPAEVTPYNIAYKYFSILLMITGIVNAPLWSAYTEAYIKKEYQWIINSNKKVLQIWFGFAVIGLIMLAASSFIYKFWLGDIVHIPFSITLSVFALILVTTFGSPYVILLNGLSKTKVQFIAAIIATVLFFPLAYVLAIKLELGVPGIVISSIICNFNGYLLAPLQYIKLKRKWNE